MKCSKLLLAVVALSCVMLSCSSDDEENLGDAKQVVYMLSNPQPLVLTEGQKQFSNDNNRFTLSFLKNVNDANKSGKSFIYSPLSVTYVLGMVNDAATGETQRELEQTLGFHEGGIQAVNEYCKKLIEGLPKVDEKVTLNIANALFVNKNKAQLKPQFQQDMQQYYEAKVENLDFSSSATLGIINDWCNDHTNGMIPKILDKVDSGILTYLLNAIYFKADWASKFDVNNTKMETFHSEKGKVEMPLMHQNVLISYLRNDVYSSVIIPYGSGLWNMTVLLPEEGISIDDVINEVTTNNPHLLNDNGWCGTGMNVYQAYEVDLKLPRFETNSDTDDIVGGLVGILQKMGIRRAFTDILAEIPDMCNVPVYIDMMRQKAAIKVNEEGSEAAAVTVGGVTNYSVSAPIEYPKATFHANRPFVYVISEASSGVILFVGKFMGE